MKVKQKDILEILKPYSMEVTTPGNISNKIRINEFLFNCIELYKKKTRAVNVKYQKESEA